MKIKSGVVLNIKVEMVPYIFVKTRLDTQKVIFRKSQFFSDYGVRQFVKKNKTCLFVFLKY